MPTLSVERWCEINGVSVFEVDGGIDSGPIITQKEIRVDVKLSQWRLIEFTKYMGIEAVLEAWTLSEMEVRNGFK